MQSSGQIKPQEDKLMNIDFQSSTGTIEESQALLY